MDVYYLLSLHWGIYVSMVPQDIPRQTNKIKVHIILCGFIQSRNDIQTSKRATFFFILYKINISKVLEECELGRDENSILPAQIWLNNNKISVAV